MATILVVDDHPAIRLIIKTHLLQMLGVTNVIEADTGQSAIETVRHRKPDMAVLDLDIPLISGLDVIPRVRLLHPAIRILVLSAQDPATFAPRSMRAGAHGFVSKSQDMREIVHSVEAVLAGYTADPGATHSRSHASDDIANEESQLTLLSNKEIVILQMLAKGMSNKTVGEALFISTKTVSSHKVRIMQKLRVSTLVELVDFARRCRVAWSQ